MKITFHCLLVSLFPIQTSKNRKLSQKQSDIFVIKNENRKYFLKTNSPLKHSLISLSKPHPQPKHSLKKSPSKRLSVLHQKKNPINLSIINFRADETSLKTKCVCVCVCIYIYIYIYLPTKLKTKSFCLCRSRTKFMHNALQF